MSETTCRKQGTTGGTMIDHYTTVDYSNCRLSAWARCSCGWLGPVRRDGELNEAYEDQDTHQRGQR